LQALTAAMYLAFVIDNEMYFCNLICHDTATPLTHTHTHTHMSHHVSIGRLPRICIYVALQHWITASKAQA
jgi:hypothetical protein